MKWCVILLGFLVPSFGAAEEPEVDATRALYNADKVVLVQCLDAAQTVDAAVSCQRRTVVLCQDRIGADISRVQMSDCILRENKMLLRLYQAAFQQVLAGAAAIGQDREFVGSSWMGAFQTVLAAQAAWHAFAQAQCDMDNLHYGAGTARGTADPACAGRMLAQRIYILQHHPLQQ